MLQQQGGILHRRHTKDKDGEPEPGLPELQSLVQAGHSQVVRSQLLQFFGHRHGAVTIGVGLYHPQEAAARRRQPP